MRSDLLKYNVAAPRYTSYPTVPFWEAEQWSIEGWLNSVKTSYTQRTEEGISLYIHLPFCESLCTYCGCNTRITKNHGVELPYINAVIKEWKLYCALLENKPLIREIHLGGGTPTFFSAENLSVLINGILESARIASEHSFSFEAHPANTTYQHLETLYQLGFRRLSLGIQDFDPAVQEIINRNQSFAQVKAITDAARAIGYTSINYDLIYGLPLQKMASVEETIRQVLSLMPERIAFYSYAHVPWLKPGQRKFTEDDLPRDNEKLALYERGRDLLLKAGYFDIGMDHFSLVNDSLFKASKNETLHRNFMGYTDQRTQLLIGLGVSSVSDSWIAFAQNTKQVETYLDTVDQGKFPLVKGHILTASDLKIRKHILNIMCKGHTECSWQDFQISQIRERLVPLEDDGLIELYPDELRVTKAGKSFLRNICMAFDERLWNKQPQSQLFSKAI